MTRTLRAAWLGWLFSLLCASALAFDEPAAGQLQAVPPLTGPVVDLTGTLDGAQREQLSQKLRALHEQYGAQMQVLIVPTTQPEDAFSYSLRVVETWQLGSKEKDDGLLLLIALNDRKTQIQTGYGLEGVIPDIVAKSLLRDTLAPFLRQGDFAGGIHAVIDGVYARISGEVTELPRPQKERVEQADWVAVVIVGAIATAILAQVLGNIIASGIGAIGVFWLAVALYGTSVLLALVLAVITPLVAQLFRQGHGAGGGGGWSGGGGGFGGGGGWSGGGGGFGGGGAGGNW